MLGVSSKNKKSTLTAWSQSFGRLLTLADDNLVLAVDHVIYIDAGEVVYHIRYHFLSIFNLRFYYNTVFTNYK